MKTHINWLHKLTLITLVIFVGIMYLSFGRDYLYDWDEGIYSQLGVEMRASGNLLTPTWNGDVWLEKPPAVAWVTALGQSIVGDLELGSRLLMPLFAAITLFGIYQIGNYFGGTLMGAMSMAMLGYFDLFLARTRAVNTDGMLLAGITLLIWFLLKGSSSLKVALAITLAVFAKGPAGLLAIIIALPLFWHKPKKYLLAIAGYCAIFILPWHIYQYIVNGATFYTPYLLEQVLRRATVPIEFHLESRWFYFVHLYRDLGLGILVVAALGLMLTRRPTLLLAWWTLAPLAIFTLAKTRLPWYILPAYPGIALLVAHAITKLRVKKNISIITIISVGMLLQMLHKSYQYVDPSRASSPLPDQLQVATHIATRPGNTVAFLVSPSERVAEAILPHDQRISSSFRYGGAPSVVLYSNRHVAYYYNYEDFERDVRATQFDHVIVSTPDQHFVSDSYDVFTTTKGYIGYTKKDNDVNR